MMCAAVRDGMPAIEVEKLSKTLSAVTISYRPRAVIVTLVLAEFVPPLLSVMVSVAV